MLQHCIFVLEKKLSKNEIFAILPSDAVYDKTLIETDENHDLKPFDI